MRNVNVACVQTYPMVNEKKKNVNQIAKWIEKIMEEHVDTDIIVFPELAINGYDASKQEFIEMAETAGKGEAFDKIAALAAKYHVYITYGYAEIEGSDLYNSTILIDRAGRPDENYRKIHLFADEKKWSLPGEDFKVANTDFGKIGMMICYDTVFPEAAGSLCRMGAEMLIISSNWESPYSYDWDLVCSSRAYDNTIFVVAANRIGQDRKLAFFGHSRILDPIGQVLESLDEEKQGYIWRNIDLDETKRLRQEYYTILNDRRPELYRR